MSPQRPYSAHRTVCTVAAVVATSLVLLSMPTASTASVLPTLSVSDADVREGTEPRDRPPEAFFVISLSAASSSTVAVAYEIRNGTTQTTDGVMQNDTVSFAPGTTTMRVPALAYGDCTLEHTETFYLFLSDPVGAVIADGVGKATLYDDDETHLKIADAATTEGTYDPLLGNHTTVVTLQVTRDPVVDAHCEVSVRVEVSSGSASTTGTGGMAAADTLAFEPGSPFSTATIEVLIPTDDYPEPDELIFVDLYDPTNAVIDDGRAVVAVTDDDGGTTPTDLPTLSVVDASVTEGAAGGATTIEARFSLSAPAATDVTASFTTRANMSLSQEDTPFELGFITIPAGLRTSSLFLPVRDDKRHEPRETFFGNLSLASGATIGDGQAIFSVADDDAGVGLFVNDVTLVEGTGEDSTYAHVVIRLTDPLPDDTRLAWHTRGNTADTPADVMRIDDLVTIHAGETEYHLDLPVTADSIREPMESFFVYLSQVEDTGIIDAAAAITILDDDRSPTSILYTGGTSGQYSDPVTLSARLSSADGPVAGSSLEFTLGGAVAGFASTSAAGDASTTVVLTHASGSIARVGTTFVGDSMFAPSAATAPFTVLPEDCTLEYAGETSSSGATTLTAVLGEIDTSLGDRSGKTITFTLADASGSTSTVTAATNAAGRGSTSATLAEGTYSVRPSFAGDTFYRSCSGQETFVVVSHAGGASDRVTGGGAAGDGPVGFGFVASSRSGASNGQLQASFPGEGRFHADALHVLTVTGSSAAWRGSGYWNGEPDYAFEATAIDGDRRGRRSGDSFTIVVKSPSGATVASGGGALTRGNIMIH